MTASVQYWRLPEEEADMIAYLRSVEPTVAIPLRTVASPDDLAWRPVEEALRDPDEAFLITPARFVPKAKVHRIDTPLERGFTISVTDTPALYYSRGHLLTPQRLLTTSLSGYPGAVLLARAAAHAAAPAHDVAER